MPAAQPGAEPGTGLSLETKLGMVTITILVVTFGFLVYRKVDLHQQQLTQASIPPQHSAAQADRNGAAGETSPAEHSARSSSSASSSLGQGSDSGAAAPGFSRTAEDQFADSPPRKSNQPPEQLLAAAEFGSSQSLKEMRRPESMDAMSFDLPETSSPATADSLKETAASEELPLNEFMPAPATDADATLDFAALAEPTGAEPTGPEPTGAEPTVVTPSVSSAAVSAAPWDFAVGEPSPSDVSLPGSQNTPRLINTADDIPVITPSNAGVDNNVAMRTDPAVSPALGAQTAEPLAEVVLDFGSSQAPEGSENPVTPAPSMATFPEASAAQDSEFAAQSGKAVGVSPGETFGAAVPAATREARNPNDAATDLSSAASLPLFPQAESDPPVMELAMLDPPANTQSADPFLGSLADPTIPPKTPAEGTAPQNTTSSEPLFPALELEADFPSVANIPPSAAESGNPFNTAPPAAPAAAVKPAPAPQPSAMNQNAPAMFPASTPARRPMARSADGKFSLAAFNYQNSVDAPVDDGQTYEITTVQPGENYYLISKRVYGTIRYFSALAVFNQHRIPEPARMRPGMKVLTPPRELLERQYPELFVDSRPKVAEPSQFIVREDGSAWYRVGENETLSEISERFLGRSARWIEIYRLNQGLLKDPNLLKPGITLALPDDAVEVNISP